MPDSPVAVTIGIPTYKRPDCLARALACVARQTYPNVRVLVSDNATPGSEVDPVIQQFAHAIPGLQLFKQPINIGQCPNFFFLLNQARTKYFMWLADDDEISDNYVQRLVELLEADPNISTASGNWYWLTSPHTGRLMPARSYASPSVVLRLLRYVWRADDAFFYGLHRTEFLNRARFSGYAWPNRDSVMNWAYVYLLDMVLRGKVLVHPDTSVRFINHDYTVKSYTASEARLAGMLKHAIRRINVHVLYLGKIVRALGPIFALPFCLVSMASLLKEGAASFALRVKGKWAALTRAGS